MFLLKNGNHKLSTDIAIWNLPRTSCIGKGECYKFCYAKKFEHMTQVEHYRDFRSELAREPLFDKLISLEIKYKGYKYVRIHECGDFFNQTYLNKWKSIANSHPKTTFMAYTKSMKLNFNDLPKNLIIIQSYGGKWDSLIDETKNTARVILHKEDVKDNEYLCPYGQSNFTKCFECCKYCWTKKGVKHVAFIMHNQGRRIIKR